VLNVGDKVGARTLTTITGTHVSIPSQDRLVHLQFRRFAGCPICSLHMREVAGRSAEIAAVGITEVVLFHSTGDKLRRYQADLPFAVVADPDRKLYKEFGVESSFASVLYPRAMLAAVRGLAQTQSLTGAMDRSEDHSGKPADFLIGSDGTVLARKYGNHADDQWSVDELLTLAAARRWLSINSIRVLPRMFGFT
jgi:peroxiredoxin